MEVNNTLEKLSQGKDNNLNLVRLFAAFMVMYMHSLALCQANLEADIMYTLTFHKALSGQVGVDIFFVISGFLIYRSYERNNSIWKYLKARFLRIWPLLAVFILSTAFIFGPLFTTVSKQEYYSHEFFKEYLLNLFFISGRNRLPGVFAFHINQSSNGSIWTLQYEVICYLLVIAFALLFRRYKKAVFGVILVSFGTYLYFKYFWAQDTFCGISKDIFVNSGRLSMEFEVGVTYYLYRDKIILSLKYFLIAVVGVVACTYFLDFELAFAVFGAYIVMFIGFGFYGISRFYNKVGDISYGVYIISFFVQQRVIDVMGASPDGYQVLHMDPYINLAVSSLIVVPIAFVSWHLFEKQLLKLK